MTATAPDQPVPREQRWAYDEFVAYIQELCTSKGTQAQLRSGLGRPVERCTYLHRYLVPWTSESTHPDTKRALYAVAALIAARPRSAREADAQAKAAAAIVTEGTGSGNAGQGTGRGWQRRPTLGSSLGLAVRAGVLKPASAEGDLHLMTRQSSDAIHPRLPALTRQLLAAGIPVDWAVLIRDLGSWNRERDRRATQWLEDYWRAVNTAPAALGDEPTDKNSGRPQPVAESADSTP
ncbi:type I-E CRISPR-associated protein Cse2/CasB [Streptacidiphilus neutrinimicus]|uniref:type I-E CRISPR-associated protein Cse2/CasB n=1 Tax=Streptacidiphilus neutrinimicus TaxID=105420 RepID=UPI0007C82361|nr:type I-E CRISPR-associated protein Cse2/CasB [Streptacidiphilus neutrinimicus]